MMAGKSGAPFFTRAQAKKPTAAAIGRIDTQTMRDGKSAAEAPLVKSQPKRLASGWFQAATDNSGLEMAPANTAQSGRPTWRCAVRAYAASQKTNVIAKAAAMRNAPLPLPGQEDAAADLGFVAIGRPCSRNP